MSARTYQQADYFSSGATNFHIAQIAGYSKNILTTNSEKETDHERLPVL